MNWLRASIVGLLLACGASSPALASNSKAFDARVQAVRTEIMANPAAALTHAETLRQSDRDAADPESRVRAATIDWLRAEALINLNRPRDALAVINGALPDVRKYAPTSELLGKLVRARGGASALVGRVQDALADYQEAFRIFGKLRDPRDQSIALLSIGAIYWDAGDFRTALKYEQDSIDIYSSDPNLLLSAHNNSGNALFELRRYGEAEQEFEKALDAATRIGSPLLQVRVLQNIARAQALSSNYDAAEATLARGYRIAENGPAAAWRPALDGVAALVAYRRHDLVRAATLITRAVDGARDAGAAMPMLDFQRTAYEIFRDRGDSAAALKHLEAFQLLDNQKRALAASTTAALMNARFNFTNQELRINNLRSEQAVAQAKFRSRMLLALLSAAAIISTLLLIGFLSIRRSRNQVRDANATLSATNIALEKALAAKTEFLATTSHEIRTPLNGILGMTQVILAGRALDPTLRGRIELVHGAGETMKALVDDILDVAKMETGELSIHTGEMDLKRLLEDAVTVWTGQAETKRIGIEFDLEHCPGKIIADEVRLRQIIFNLMSNAIKFTDRGHVRLAALSEEEGETGREKLVIRVADSGIGIPPDRIEDIFESFRQVDGGVTRRHGGTGLGLAICRSLARAMGGDVEVASVLGTGSTFTLTLPLERCAAEIARADRPAATNLAGAELLMIEPNPLGQGIMRALLAGECANLQFAIDVPAALDVLGKAGVDHVVAEGSALGLDPASAGALAAACAAANARFTLLWREPSSDLLIAFRDQGVTHVVAKPISAPDLLSEMNRVYGQPIASRNIAA